MADGEKYVVHGMKAKCSEGSMENYINTDKGHGVVYQGQPVLNANDHVKEINLTHFGDCKSKLIFEEAKKQADEKYKAEEGDGFFGKLGKGIAKTVTKAVIGTKEIFASNKCELDTPLPWIFTSRDHMIDGAPALTVESQCPCKFGGTISIIPQEEEAAVEAEEFRQAVVVDAPKVVPMSAAVGKSDTDKSWIEAMVEAATKATKAKIAEDIKKEEEKKKKDKKRKGNTGVTKEQLQQLYKESGHFQAGKVTDDMVNDLNRVLEKYDITTPEQIQYFIAVCLHESRLSLTEAGWCSKDYVKKYCEMYEPGTSRGKDLGNVRKGDGFLFRGAGYIQLTGRSNYKAFANTFSDKNIRKKIMSKGADYVEVNYAWKAAGFFWKTNNINNIISKGNANNQDSITTFKQVSNAVNRGPGGTYSSSPPGEWAERKAKFEIARKIIK